MEREEGTNAALVVDERPGDSVRSHLARDELVRSFIDMITNHLRGEWLTVLSLALGQSLLSTRICVRSSLPNEARRCIKPGPICYVTI